MNLLAGIELNELVIACELRKRARVLGVMVKEWSW
jgi:hypothetical protein